MTTAVAVIGPRGRRSLADRSSLVGSVVLGVLLSADIVGLVLGQHDGGVVAAILAVSMTAPVAYAWLAPTAAGLSLAIAAGANELFFGHLVRCGPGLPAAFFVAFVAGYALGRQARFALAGTVVSIVLQCVFDPRLGVGVIALMVPLTLVFFAAGLYVRHRAAMVASLRESSIRLYDQRERTTRLAVAADREELTEQLSGTLRQRLDGLAAAAHSGDGGRDQFARIEQLGRETLDEMRGLLGSLRDSPTRPEPGLADLSEVCARATTAQVRLTVDGARRPLPASIELSACRIVEQLLRLVLDEPAARVQLRVDVAVEGLDIVLAGTPTVGGELEDVRALVDARAALHGGSVSVTDDSGQREARVWLPLVSAHG